MWLVRGVCVCVCVLPLLLEVEAAAEELLLPDGFSSLGTSFCMSAWPNSQPGGRLGGSEERGGSEKTTQRERLVMKVKQQLRGKKG